MFSRLSLRTRFFLLSSLLLAVSLAVVYVFVRPQYDQALLAERTTIVSEQLHYAIQSADHEFSNWFGIAKYLATTFSTRPTQFESALRDQIGTHPDLIRISVISLQTGDELEAQNSNYPNRTIQLLKALGKPCVWIHHCLWRSTASTLPKSFVLCTRKHRSWHSLIFLLAFSTPASSCALCFHCR
jgi:hypothetical protein